MLNLNDPKTAGPLIGLQVGTVYGFNLSFTTQYPELTKALVGALLSGLDAVKKVAGDPAAVLNLFPAGIKAKLTDGWAGSWALSSPGITASDGSIPPKPLADTLAFAKSAGQLTAAQAATASTVVDSSFIK